LLKVTFAGLIHDMMVPLFCHPNIKQDILTALEKTVPRGIWLHDQMDGNADAHIKAGIVGASETIPLEDGKLLLSTWQNVFFCDFDGPRPSRELVVTLLP